MLCSGMQLSGLPAGVAGGTPRVRASATPARVTAANAAQAMRFRRIDLSMVARGSSGHAGALTREAWIGGVGRRRRFRLERAQIDDRAAPAFRPPRLADV